MAKPNSKPATAVANKENTDVMVFSEQLPAHLQGMQSNRGSENVTMSDMVVPRLELVQSLSPCRKKTDPNYIEGCEEGDLYNNVTRELYGKSVVVVPVAYKKEYLLWKQRDKGGGFKGAYETQEAAEHARDQLDDGDVIDVVDTAQNYCLLINGDRIEEIVISMTKSKMKVARRWNSMIRLAGGDRFSKAYRINTVEDKSEKGEFYNVNVVSLGYVSMEVFKKAEKMYESVMAGLVTADRGGDDIDGTIVDDDSEM